jgi:uncharacterized membrane protein
VVAGWAAVVSPRVVAVSVAVVGAAFPVVAAASAAVVPRGAGDMNFVHLLKHLTTSGWLARRRFRYADRETIRAAVAASESLHRGELRVIIEGPLPLRALFSGQTARERAEHLFVRLGVGATEEATGILVYVQLVDHRVEILADRGIAECVAQTEWEGICREMEVAFSEGAWRRGVLEAIDRASHLLALHFPARGHNPNELDDRPKLF